MPRPTPARAASESASSAWNLKEKRGRLKRECSRVAALRDAHADSPRSMPLKKRRKRPAAGGGGRPKTNGSCEPQLLPPLGGHIKVYWDGESAWYEGIVVEIKESSDPSTSTYTVFYPVDEVTTEHAPTELWQLDRNRDSVQGANGKRLIGTSPAPVPSSAPAVEETDVNDEIPPMAEPAPEAPAAVKVHGKRGGRKPRVRSPKAKQARPVEPAPAEQALGRRPSRRKLPAPTPSAPPPPGRGRSRKGARAQAEEPAEPAPPLPPLPHVGTTVRVHWAGDGEWYTGNVVSADHSTAQYLVHYPEDDMTVAHDASEPWEVLADGARREHVHIRPPNMSELPAGPLGHLMQLGFERGAAQQALDLHQGDAVAAIDTLFASAPR